MPFAGYEDHAACVADNADKDDPDAYCAALERSVRGSANPNATPEWFRNPELDEPTPFTVTADGQVFGHLAAKGVCHVGIADRCLMVDELMGDDYQVFARSPVVAAGSEVEGVRVGVVTMGTGHAPLRVNHAAAAAHYDHTGTVAADVAVGEDRHGIWVAGAAREGADWHALRSAALSGDWRTVNGRRRLVAALAVNTPGFPIVSPQALVASVEGSDDGEVEAATGIGVVDGTEGQESEQEAPQSDENVEPEQTDLQLVTAALEALASRIDQLTATEDPEPEPVTETESSGTQYSALAKVLAERSE